ncbi:MAG: T9SS type A sorting domain-containing protein, partial [Bacteroidia bacterium]|nr:T9SS type A sorting domain-containing protein [Bacteroidia bacterium]
VNYANTDPTVDWIITLGHRPYQAEQYVGDISSWIRNTVVPFCVTSPKYLMHIGAHHHIYSRGQMKETPNYNMISGGTAWDQYWGMSTETDMDDVQKTISNWIYNIIDVDVVNDKVDVESYSIGSNYKWKNNELMDSFHRYKNQAGPAQPTITNAFPDSLQLPYTINSSAFVSVPGELLNSTQFQISQTLSFSSNEVDRLRDYENLFGSAGSVDSTADINLGVNILNYNILSGALPNGWHYVRTRQRDRNLEWSAWSPADSFKIYNSVVGFPLLYTDTTIYAMTDTVFVTYANGTGNPQDWIGIYKLGEVPGGVGSTQWSYVTGTAGTLSFVNLPVAGQYFVAYFSNNGFTEIAPRDTFYVGPIPVLTTDQTNYPLGDTVHVTYTTAPAFTNDWIGIYKIGNVPGQVPSTQWSYTTGANGTLDFIGLPKGYYFAAYYILDGYTQIGQKVFFSVGDTITNLFLDKSIYNLGEYITATWSDGPGIVKDWLGIYNQGDNPNIDPLVTYTYFGGVPNGTKVLMDSILPPVTGNYFIVMFTNDSYNEVSNRVDFQIIDTLTTGLQQKGVEYGIKLYPNPSDGRGQTIIESEYPIEKIELLNQTGQVVFVSRNVKADKFSFITQDLPAGIYFIKIHTRKLFTYKLIITR